MSILTKPVPILLVVDADLRRRLNLPQGFQRIVRRAPLLGRQASAAGRQQASHKEKECGMQISSFSHSDLPPTNRSTCSSFPH